MTHCTFLLLFFNEKYIPISSSFNKTSLKNDSKSIAHSTVLIFLIPSLFKMGERNNLTPPCPTYQSNKPPRTNQMPRSWANGFFIIEGFAGKRSLPSPPPPPRSSFLFSPQFSARPECNFFSRPYVSFGSYGIACYASNQ